MTFYTKSNEVSERIGYTSNLAYNYLNMAGVYLACNQIYRNQLFEDEIWDFSLRGIKAALESQEWEVALACMVNAGLLNLQNPQKTKFSEIVDLISSVKIPSNVNMRDFYLTFMKGSQMFTDGNYDAAFQEYSNLERMVDVDSMLGARYMILVHTAEAYSLAGMGKYPEAIAVTRQYISEATQAGLSDEATKGYLCLSEYYNKIGDLRGSSNFLLDFYTKKDSILSAREVNSIGNMPLTNQIDQLSVQFQQERETKERLSIILWIAVPFAVVLLLFVIFLYRARRKERKYTKEIYRKNVELLKEEEASRLKIKALQEEVNSLEKNIQELRGVLNDKQSAGASVSSSDSLSPEKTTSEGLSGEDTSNVGRYRNLQIPEETEKVILEKVREMLDDTNLICNSNFSLIKLSEAIGYSYKQVSQVINDKTGNNFKTMLNEKRIKEACRRLIDQENYGSYTIEHIARSVGFQSRSHFSVCFKSVVGISPSDFQRNARGEE